ncbi:MAG: thioredoxin fold domain-containing protein [Gammaproteobacteria bacterium]|nr:thioredoxin fold domain-containing protein [Gammaproteobacteria bacterium]
MKSVFDQRTMMVPLWLMACVMLISLPACQQKPQAKQVAEPAVPPLWQELLQRPGVWVGPKQPRLLLQVFFDPNCPYCHRVWEYLKPYEKAGLAVRWIPVAFIKPSSMDKAVAILAAKDPAQAFEYNESHYDTVRFEGGLLPAYGVSTRYEDEVKENAAWLKRTWEGVLTPTVAYLDVRVQVQHFAGWMPDQRRALARVLAPLGGPKVDQAQDTTPEDQEHM